MDAVPFDGAAIWVDWMLSDGRLICPGFANLDFAIQHVERMDFCCNATQILSLTHAYYL